MPLLGLGLYGGHRGNRWLKNRIKIFKQFVVPSLLNQTSQNFVLWVSVRYVDKSDSIIQEFAEYLSTLPFKTVVTYSGVCFWDDKYDDAKARDRLIHALHGSLQSLINVIGDSEHVLMTIQPSDDCYERTMVEGMQRAAVAYPDAQAFAYRRGYVMDYTTLKLAEWNPKTNPPFYTIKFPRKTFIEPLEHVAYAGIKSHEYLPEKLVTRELVNRGFLVGTHGENISTVFNHPFRGLDVPQPVLAQFGLAEVKPLIISTSLRKMLMRKLPHGWQRKLRYWLGERSYARFYDFIRS